MEFDGGALVRVPVLELGVNPRVEGGKQGEVSWLQVRKRERAAALLRTDERRLGEAADQVVPDLLAQVLRILGRGDLVADHGQRNVMAGRVVAVLTPDRDS